MKMIQIVRLLVASSQPDSGILSGLPDSASNQLNKGSRNGTLNDTIAMKLSSSPSPAINGSLDGTNGALKDASSTLLQGQRDVLEDPSSGHIGRRQRG